MHIRFQKAYLDFKDIKGSWEILNPMLGYLNSERIHYEIGSTNATTGGETGVFYLHGLGSSLHDCPELEQVICPRTQIIRVECFGVANSNKSLAWATFGDVCAMLYNSRQAVYTLVDMLELKSYCVVAHSWGGFIACLVGLGDSRCEKAMLLTAAPDICDALSRMYELAPFLPTFLRPVADLLMGKLREDAKNAKTGESWHQTAWDEIDPYKYAPNRRLEMLIFNRLEDKVMLKENVEAYVEHARRRGMDGIGAEFSSYPGLHWHDMPYEMFGSRMEHFLFGEPS